MGRREKVSASIIFVDLTLTDSECEDSSELVKQCTYSETDTLFEPALNIHGNILTSRHYKILKSTSSWFNDDIINGFFCKLSDAHSQSVFAFSSFFYSSLLKRGREFCLKHAIPKDFNGFLNSPASTDKIVLFPVNSGGSHWALVAWYADTGTLRYYDSMMCKRSGNRIMKHISELFNEFIEGLNDFEEELSLEDALKGLTFSEEDGAPTMNSIKLIQKLEIPKGQTKQTDGSSCGPFCCLFAKQLVTNTEDVDIYQFRRSLIDFFLDK